MSLPLVSIITRTKDRNVLLDRAIADIARQSYENFELIIVNDGGDPNGVNALLEKHKAALAGRGRALHNQSSQGMERASNQGIEATSGKYVCIHDDDDTWHPKFLETCVEYLEAHPSHGGVAVRTEIVLEVLKGGGVTEIGREIAWPKIHQFSLSKLMVSNIAVPISCMYPREVINNLGGFRSDLPVVGDWEFHIRLAATYEVGFLDEKPLAYWHQRRRQGGVLGNSVFAGADKHAYFELKVRDEYLRDYVEKNGMGALLWQAAFFHELISRKESTLGWARRKAIEFVRSRRGKKK
ncbi:MAG: glycosyltransferase family 2 protein [Actinomycetaceae bacterium]|nr:glycosyltransferase family 2 protein [Actinomycetaceae bacterium]